MQTFPRPSHDQTATLRAMDRWLQDSRRALRALAARPGPALVAVITLTLGLASTTTLFSVADALLIRPFFYRSPERIVDFAVQLNDRPANGVYSPAAWRLLQARSDAFAGVEAYRPSNVVMTGGVEPSEVSILETSPGLLRLLGIAPQIGRWFDDDDGRGGHGPVVVLSDRLWREELGGNPAIVGTTVTFNDTPHTVVGIMPREFVFPRVAFRAWTLLPASLPERPGLIDPMLRLASWDTHAFPWPLAKIATSTNASATRLGGSAGSRRHDRCETCGLSYR